MVKEDESENVWWQRLRTDDPEAMAYFYDKYADWLLRYGLSIVYNRDVVRDAVQELFLYVWNRRRHLSAPDSVKYYLMVSLRRLILTTVREERNFSDHVEGMQEPVLQQETQEGDIYEALQKAIRALPPRQQEVIFLKYYEKLSYEQISGLTGLDYQVLRNTIHRAVKALRIFLANQADILITALFLIIF